LGGLQGAATAAAVVSPTRVGSGKESHSGDYGNIFLITMVLFPNLATPYRTCLAKYFWSTRVVRQNT